MSATTDCEAMPTLCAARLVCDDTLGCGTVDPVPSGTPCDDGLGTDGNWCNSACQSGACVPAMAAMCDDGNECTVDSCDPLLGCVATDLPLDAPCLGTNNDRCTARCDDRAQCVDLVDVMCDDALPCTIDICADGVCSYVPGNGGTICRPAADTCDAVEVCTGGSPTCPPDNPLMLVEAPASVPMRQQVTVTVTLPCANEAANLTCITNSKRFCLDGPLTFEGNQGNFVGSGVTNANCGADGVSTANCFNNDGGGDILRIQRNSNAARSIAVDATGFTNLRVHLKAAFPGTTDNGEVARIRGCCNAPGCTNQIGTANSYDDNGIDAWGDRPCRRTCTGSGYAFGAAFDNCPSVTNNIDWRATGSDEHVHIDNFAISGIGTLTLQMNDNGDGTYTSSFAACVATTVTVTCTWTYRGGMTATTSVDFY